MSTHVAYIVKVNKLRPHPNADKLQLLEVFGTETCVGLGVAVGDIGVYFPSDLQLSPEFCEVNHLCRKKLDGTPDTGYMEPDKRNVKTIKLRGERSDGIYLPLTCLASFGDISSLRPGDRIDVFNAHQICQKYIPRGNPSKVREGGNRVRKKKVNIAPLFQEHADTEQLAYNLAAFKPGDEIEITLKMHGTSQRTAYVPVLTGYKRTIWDKLFKRKGTPIYDWGYVSGTRRTVLENYDGGYYGSNEFREQHSKTFEGKLWKGETVYYEVVGFTHTGAPIMATADNKKMNDKEFIKQYGDTTTFSYGCAPRPNVFETIQEHNKPQSDIYVYRMTLTNEDGDVVEYTPDFMRYRCEQMGIKTVLAFIKETIPHEIQNEKGEWVGVDAGEWVKELAEAYYDGPDPIGKTHVREGVVVRILNRPKFCAYKHKNFAFKVLENIIKDVAEAPDMEEAEEIIEEV